MNPIKKLKKEKLERVDIFSYTNYRKYLLDYYTIQKKQTRFFSYRYFSSKAGFSSHNVLKNVLHGNRNIGINSILKFSTALNLTAKEAEYFKLLVLYDQSKSEHEKNDLLLKIHKYRQLPKAKKLSKLQNKFFSDWYHVAVRELIVLKDFKEDYEYLAAMLFPPIKPEQVKESLRLLEEINLIRRDKNGGLKQVDPHLEPPEGMDPVQYSAFVSRLIKLGENAMQRFTPSEREIRVLTYPVTQKAFHELAAAVRNFMEEAKAIIISDTAEPQIVCQLNVQLFPLVNTPIVSDQNNSAGK